MGSAGLWTDASEAFGRCEVMPGLKGAKMEVVIDVICEFS